MKPETSLSVFCDDETLKSILGDDSILRDALSGDTAAAVSVWRSIADKTADVGRAVVWAQHVAAKVQRDVIEIPSTKKSANPKARGQQALIAIGIPGVVEKYADVRRMLDALSGFDDLTNPESQTTHRKYTQICIAAGLFNGLDEGQALRIVERIRQEKD